MGIESSFRSAALFLAVAGSAAVLVAIDGCGASTPAAAAADEAATHTVYIVRRERHTGIAVRPADWPDRQWPVLASFPEAQFLEFGWGDAEYYQADEKTLGMTLRAALWPTPSVMEVLAPRESPLTSTDDYAAVELPVSAAQLQRMAASIEHSFTGPPPAATGTVKRTADGESRFYAARGKFHFFRMCNRWTADRLQEAGCKLGPLPVITASRVLQEAQRCRDRRR